MANKSANPFLMMDEDYVSPSQASSNPFLMAADDFAAATEEAVSDNPFFGQATNPFAGGFDAPDYDTATTSAAMDFFTSADPLPTTAGDSIYSNATNDMFETTQATETITTNSSFFHTTIHDMEGFQPPIQPQKPTDLQLKQTNTIASSDEILNAYSSEEELTNKTQPRRPPPPPRPVPPPPSKETQDLILSVTGHMDFTSSHLLDRIPATRTPSPVSMRDLHSPSPTPDHSFAEFLNTDDKPPQPAQTVDFFDLGNDADATIPNLMPEIAASINSAPILNDNPFADVSSEPMAPAVCDINQNQSIKSCPPRPTPPRPPRPTPPQKPPPPVIPNAPIHPPVPTSISHGVAPPHPPPPKVPQPASIQAAADDDFMDIFGDKPKGPPPPKSNQDILSLFSTNTTTASATTDLLSDDIPLEMAPTVTETQELSEPDVVPKMIETPIIPDITHEKPTPETSVGSDPTPVDELSVIEASTEQEVSPKSNPFAIEEIDDFASHDDNQNEFMTQEIDFTKDLPKEEVPSNNIFETTSGDTNIFQTEMMSISPEPIQAIPDVFGTHVPQTGGLSTMNDEFDAFSAKFDSTGPQIPDSIGKFTDPFGDSDMDAVENATDEDVWGSNVMGTTMGTGFQDDDDFDAFHGPAPTPTPNYRDASSPTTGQSWFESKPKHSRTSFESDEEKDFSVVIRPIEGSNAATTSAMPVLAPPPRSPMQSAAFSDTSPRFNPFDKSMNMEEDDAVLPNEGVGEGALLQRTDSQETPPTPLFDEDVSQPLEEFPRIHYDGIGWEMQLRQPNKKRITGQRFWKKIFLKVCPGESPMIQLFNAQGDKDPFTELPLQACYSVSEIGAQQYDHYGKIFTIKLQYIFYKERPGVRPGQVKKAERITNKLSQFAAYAIQGDYQGVKEFGSDLKKLGLPVEHAPQISQLFKIGCANYEDLKQLSMWVEEGLFKLNVHRDRALNYKMEEVQITAVDELYVEQDAEGRVLKQIARVRLFFLGFLTGMPDVELGVNDMWRQGKEVVGRHDIIPVVTEEWIRLEAVEFHACVQQDEYEKSRIIKFKPPDACYIELMRFRIRPPKNRELPLQLKAVMCITGNKVELKADVLVPGFASRKLGQVPCEDVMIRFPIPECWIYLFRVEKHFRYGSVKSAHRRTGKIKGIERFLGTVETIQESLIEVTSGQAKYEHQHRAIVWRMPRLPKEGQGAYTTHQLVCRMALTSYDQVPDQLAEYAYVEFTMPATQASHTTVRSVSLQGSDSDDPPEKYVRYLARHEYKVGIEHTQGEGPAAYAAATMITRPVETKPAAPTEPDPPAPHSDTDSDSD